MPDRKNVLVDIWLLSSLSTALVNGGLAQSRLSVDEFALYGLIHDLGPVTATQLAGWTGQPMTTLSATIRRCEKRGELVRVVDAADRRSTLIRLTDEGLGEYNAALPALSRALEQFVGNVDVPLGEARALLERLDGGLRTALTLPDRPYRVAGAQESAIAREHNLTAQQTDELAEFARWLRYRDSH